MKYSMHIEFESTDEAQAIVDFLKSREKKATPARVGQVLDLTDSVEEHFATASNPFEDAGAPIQVSPVPTPEPKPVFVDTAALDNTYVDPLPNALVTPAEVAATSTMTVNSVPAPEEVSSEPVVQAPQSEPLVEEAPTLCMARDCGRPSHARGLCSAHYQQYRYYTNNGDEAGFFEKCGVVGPLPTSKKGRKKKVVVDSSAISESAVLANATPKPTKRYKSVKSLRLTSIDVRNMDALLAQCHKKSEGHWLWVSAGGDGEVVLDRADNNLWFYAHLPTWEAQVYERNLILHVALNGGLRLVIVDGERVPISKFQYLYILPESENPDRFSIRAKTNMQTTDVKWTIGEVFKVFKFSTEGASLEDMIFWLQAPPEDLDLDDKDLVRSLLEKGMRRVSGPDILKHFDVLYDGNIPKGSYSELSSAKDSDSKAS